MSASTNTGHPPFHHHYIPTFDGTQVEIYLRRLEQLAKTHGWKKEQNISFLGVNYVGEALLWYQIKLMDEKTLTWTWSEWEMAL
jgi:hypothetical protein